MSLPDTRLITIEDWGDYFPPTSEGIRPDQEKGINFLLNHLHKGCINNFLQGPPGLGKSFIAYAIAKYYAIEFGWRSRILVPNVFLEDQYVSDFSKLGMRQLHSARHYDCPAFGSCDVGRGNELIRVQEPVDKEPVAGDVPDKGNTATLVAPVRTKTIPELRCKAWEECTYLQARTAFTAASIGVANVAYALVCARYGHDFISSDLVFFDEAHNLGDQICGMYEIVVPLNLPVCEQPAHGEELEWIGSNYVQDLKDKILWVSQDIVRRSKRYPKDPELPKLDHKVAHLQNELGNIYYLLNSPPADWVIIRNRFNATFQPLWATRMAPKLLDFLAPRRVFMSATFLDFEQHLSWLGLGK